MLTWTDHYFQNLLDDKTLRTALMEIEMSEYVSKDFDFEEFLPCYPCLHVLPEEIFYTLPSSSEYLTMSWGGPGTDERACRKCDRKTGSTVKWWIREEEGVADEKGYTRQEYYNWEWTKTGRMNIVERKSTIDSWAVQGGALKGTRGKMT